ncbi:FUN14 domain-containing protein [Rhizoctonia solani]|uniref:FUN14 domain-containing protein n=1 Tax=Rhizoctonia solani TaxID=456999 RepID=A0A8H8P8W5_9AGAM|nr:FUN14 domain-containing protein [Rhizoctonia solani]QRW27430.1 FUN14 domain-containing protein [Rhizoctonia solani]
MNAQLFRKSNHVLASACRLSRQPSLQTRSFVTGAQRLHALSIENSIAAKWKNTSSQPKQWRLGTMATVSVGLGLAAFAGKQIYCEPSVSPKSRGFSAAAHNPGPGNSGPDPLPPPQSSLSTYELTFGSVAGICAGVFVKKGAKALAFFLGGIFVLLQYFNAIDIIKPTGALPQLGEPRRPATISTLWSWLVDFLTADFPPRATFLAGMILGLRLG